MRELNWELHSQTLGVTLTDLVLYFGVTLTIILHFNPEYLSGEYTVAFSAVLDLCLDTY